MKYDGFTIGTCDPAGRKPHTDVSDAKVTFTPELWRSAELSREAEELSEWIELQAEMALQAGKAFLAQSVAPEEKKSLADIQTAKDSRLDKADGVKTALSVRPRPADLLRLESLNEPFPVDARMLWEALGVGRDFTNWMKYQIDRLSLSDGEDYTAITGEESCSPKLASKINTHGGSNRMEFSLSLDCAKHIAMASNTPAGKEIRGHFIAVEKAWNTPELVMMRGLEASQEVIRRQNFQIASLSEDAHVARRIATSTGLKTITEVAKIYGIGPKKFFALLSEWKVLYRLRGKLVPYQKYIDAGYFSVKETPFERDDGVMHLASQTYVTGKGEVWLAKTCTRYISGGES